MSELREALEQYLQLRHSLGFELRDQAFTLRNFVAFAESQGMTHITTDLVLCWTKQPSKAQPATWAARLGPVRLFAAWRSATDPRTDVPPEGLIPHTYRRKSPHIYTDEEIERIVCTAARLPSPKGLRSLTYSTYFGLLAATGMRMSEALALDRGDVDLHDGIITIRRAKFGKSRLVPVQASTCEALRVYARVRDRILHVVVTAAFFVSERGTRIKQDTARYNFAKVCQKNGLRAQTRTIVTGTARDFMTCDTGLLSKHWLTGTGRG